MLDNAIGWEIALERLVLLALIKLLMLLRGK